jgi:hypothetical protein
MSGMSGGVKVCLRDNEEECLRWRVNGAGEKSVGSRMLVEWKTLCRCRCGGETEQVETSECKNDFKRCGVGGCV